MNIFKLEAYLSEHEFRAPYLLCCSDAESFGMHEIIDLASKDERALWDNLRLSYTEAPGHPLLRRAIRKNLYPQLTRDEQILIFSGAEEGIFCALFALSEPGSHAIVLTPCYQSLREIPALKGMAISEIALREENDWRINIDDIAAAIKPTTKLIVMNFPHNPTGQVIEQDELRGLVDLCRKHDVWLFSDEVYRLLGQPKNGFASPAAEIYEKALSLGVMSKAFGLAGLRIGWLACQNEELLAKIAHIKHYTSICNSAPAEILSIIALNNKEYLLSRNNNIVAHNLLLLDKFVDDHKRYLEWVRPQGGCVGFMKYKGEGSAEHFCDELLNKKGVLLLPPSIYDVPTQHFRVGFGRANMPDALNKLGEFLA